MLTVRGLSKWFPPTRRGDSATIAVDDVELAVPAGEFASVLGPSGSGKTTLLRCVAGFERPDAGVITVGDRAVVSADTYLPAYARRVGVVPQESALFPHLTVAQNIGFGLVGNRRRGRRARVRELLGLVGLVGLGDRRPDQLSGGQQQRVALARALAPEPELVLLDEPFSALDARLRAELREEVRDLLRSIGSTVLFVTHDQAEAMSLSDRLVVLRAGRVVGAGDPRTVYDRPADADLGRFLGDAVVLPGQITRGAEGIRVACALGDLDVGRWHGTDGPCRVLVRPEQIDIRAAGGAAARPATLGTVQSQSYFGHDSLVRVDMPGLSRPISVRVAGRRAYRAGEPVTLAVTEPVCTYSGDLV